MYIRKTISCLATLSLLFLFGCASDKKQELSLSLDVVSTHAERVSGDSALIAINPSLSSIEEFDFQLNQKPINIHWISGGIDKGFYGLLEGLNIGENILSASVDGERISSLAITSHPVTGPIFSGPHQKPYLCLPNLSLGRDGNKRNFAIGNGEVLDLSDIDDNCHLPRQQDYVYVSTDENKTGFVSLEDVKQTPSDLASINTDGKEIPFIVLIETGTINRAVYQIASVVSPTEFSHVDEYTGRYQMQNLKPWNQRLVYTFGGGCEAGFHQGTSTGGVLRKDLLAKGYAIASSTLNVNRQGGCNDVISAETAMMVKEHFIETWGMPEHTIGLGSSGGAMQQHLIANAYPGILDGLIVGASFPDPITYFMDSAECALPLRTYLNNRELSDDVKTAIGGWHQWSTCDVSLGERPARISPYDCAGEIPAELAYDEVENPRGIRCSIYDGMKNVFGQVPHPRVNDLMVAPSPHDNIGVQYGLRALQAGLISKELFLDLNENVGGWDIDYQATSERTQANPIALEKAYSTGRIANGKSLSNIPIIDDRAYLDAIGNFHTSVYSFSLRARLIRDNGHADNHLIRRRPGSLNLTPENVTLMDEWISNLAMAKESEKIDGIRAAKPDKLADDCFTENGERIIETAVFSEEDLFQTPKGQCNQLYPVHGNPRIVAGAPLTGDVMKCELRPINWGEYGVEFSEAERDRLIKIFPGGVCDWSLKGIAQQQNDQWISY